MKATQLDGSNVVAIAIRNAHALLKTTNTLKERQAAIMLHQFPTKAVYKASRADGSYKAFLSTLRGEENQTTTAYMYATAWMKETYGGLLNAKGDIVVPGKSAKGMTGGRWLAALSSKLEALLDYVPKCPKADVEPDLLARVTDIMPELTALFEELAIYRAELAEADAPEPKAKAA